MLMGLSNAEGHLVLTTGNKSELATGYSTLYGDSAGRLRADQGRAQDDGLGAGPVAQRRGGPAGMTPPIPENSITKPPSAELAPGQFDTDSLPPYEVLDALLDDYVEKDMGSAELIAAGHDPALVERVIRLVDGRSTSGGSIRPGRRSARRTSAATGGCPSPTGGASRWPALTPPPPPPPFFFFFFFFF